MSSIKNAVYHHKTLELHVLPLRSDNYSYVLRDTASGLTAVVDPSETQPIIRFLETKAWGLDWILDTHHHNDHIEGNPGLKERFQAKIAASQYDIEKGRITGKPDKELKDGETFSFGDFSFRVIATPGHTLGHVSLFLEDAHWLFSGDTLFSLGCGRLFEGDPAMLWQSFQKLRELPDDTLVFCGHEYTLANARFALSVDLNNKALQERAQQVEATRNAGKLTIPTLMGEEKATNPFLRADDPVIAASVGLAGRPAVDVFTEVRERKNRA